MADLAKFLAGSGGGGDDSSRKSNQEKEQTPKKEKRRVDDDPGDFDDFSDSTALSRRGTYDDDDDDDDDDGKQPKPDLDAFMQQDEVEGEGLDEDGEEEADDEEEDEEEEYETEEERSQEDLLEPSDEIVGETPSQAEIRRQKEHSMEILKAKKKALIEEYLHEIKKLQRLRARNCILSIKIQSRTDERHAIIDKYIQAEMDDLERKKETERLKQLYYQKTCEEQKKKERKNLKKKKLSKSKEHKKKHHRGNLHTHFGSRDMALKKGIPHKVQSGNFYVAPGKSEHAADVSLKTLEKTNKYNVIALTGEDKLHPHKKQPISGDGTKKKCQRKRKGKIRMSKQIRGFSFNRLFFLADVAPGPKPTTDLMHLSLTKLKSGRSKRGKSPDPNKSVNVVEELRPSRKSTAQKVASKRISYLGLMSASLKTKRKFEMTQEAKGFAKSMRNLALGEQKHQHKIMLNNQIVDLKNLNHFKFEFADPRLTARQVSNKLRNELLSLLRERKISTGRFNKWPMEVKGVSFAGKNPYGRVTMNYTRLSHHDYDLPHLAYRMLLTNMAFLKTKEDRMTEKHKINLIRLQEEEKKLSSGLNDILNEIIDGLRMWASLSGITTLEKRKAKHDTENFIKYLRHVYDTFLNDFLCKLYKAINMNEFALRRLHISEGKGEGAELHEFKDILRCAEKLKAEHKNVQKIIFQYQNHCKSLLKVVRNTDKKLREVNDSVDNFQGDLRQMRAAVSTMIEGMYLCQSLAKRRQYKEKVMKADAGILSSPILFDDYQRSLEKSRETKIKRNELARKVNARVREIYKIIPKKSIED